MSCSSTRAVCDISNVAPSKAATGNNRLAFPPCVSNSPTYSIDRFLNPSGQSGADSHLRPPPGLGQARNAAEAEAEAKERMSAQLDTFSKKFGSSTGSRAN